MNDILQFLEHHDYWLLIAAVLGRQVCLPIPANLVVVAAGALAHSGKFSLPAIVGLSVVTFLIADLAWYEAGRRFGDRILHCVCSLSRDSEACILDQRRRYDSNEFAPKRGYYLSFPLNNRERHFELELVAPQSEFEIDLTATVSRYKSIPLCLGQVASRPA
jgi:membrane protein DedA with SNARE-associated domain